jgi:hypothetical protein
MAQGVYPRLKVARQDGPEGKTSGVCSTFAGSSVDVTGVLEGVLDENAFSLETALKGGDRRCEALAVSWRRVRQETGWTDRGLCRMLVLLKASLDKLKSVSQGMTGTTFAFDRVCLLFDEKECPVFSGDIGGQSVLFLNLLRITPVQLREGFDYLLPRELAFSIIRKGVGGAASGVVPACVGVNPYIDFAPSADFHPAETVFNTRDVARAFDEVLAVKLGLRLAESAGMAAGFRQGFRDYVNEELSRYLDNPNCERSLAQISVIAGIIAASSFLRERDIAVSLSKVACGMLSGMSGAGVGATEGAVAGEQSRKTIEAGYAALTGSLESSTRAEFRRK